MAIRLGLAPGRRPTVRWILRFAAAIFASLALWTVLLWALSLFIHWPALF